MRWEAFSFPFKSIASNSLVPALSPAPQLLLLLSISVKALGSSSWTVPTAFSLVPHPRILLELTYQDTFYQYLFFF